MQHAGEIYTIVPTECIDCTRHIRKEKPNYQSHGDRNIYPQSSSLITVSGTAKANEFQSRLQGRIQAGSKGSHKPVKQFRFLKQNIKINYQIPDYKKEFNFLM